MLVLFSLFVATQSPSLRTVQMEPARCHIPSKDRSMLAKVHKHGMGNAVWANSNSINRQKATFIKSVMNTAISSKRSYKNKCKIATRKALKEATSFKVVCLNQEKHISHEVIESTILFVNGGDIYYPQLSPVLPRHLFWKG